MFRSCHLLCVCNVEWSYYKLLNVLYMKDVSMLTMFFVAFFAPFLIFLCYLSYMVPILMNNNPNEILRESFPSDFKTQSSRRSLSFLPCSFALGDAYSRSAISSQQPPKRSVLRFTASVSVYEIVGLQVV